MPSSPRSPIYACQLLCAVRHSLEVEVDQDIEAVVALAQDIRVLRPDNRNRAEVGADELVVCLDRVLLRRRIVEGGTCGIDVAVEGR